MKKTASHFVSLIVACTLFAGVAYAGAHRMIDAIDALRRAKTGADPWKELNIAAENLRHATRNKVAYRAEALHIVESAIATHPDKITLDRMIDDAIAKPKKAPPPATGEDGKWSPDSLVPKLHLGTPWLGEVAHL